MYSDQTLQILLWTLSSSVRVSKLSILPAKGTLYLLTLCTLHKVLLDVNCQLLRDVTYRQSCSKFYNVLLHNTFC